MALSFVSYTGDASTLRFSIALTDGFFKDEDIIVTVDGQAQIVDTHYTIDRTPTTPDVVFFTAPAAGLTVKIARSTPQAVGSFSVDFQDQSGVTESELDLAVKHLLYLLQEANDNASGAFLTYDSVREVWDAATGGANRQIDNVKDPNSPQQVATQKYVTDVAQFGVAGVPQFFELNTGPGADTSFTLTGLPNAVPNSILVWLNGVIQRPSTDYTTVASGSSDTQLDLVTTPPTNADLFVFNIGAASLFATFDEDSIEGIWLKDAAVTADKIASDAVTGVKILDAAVSSAKLAAGAVTESKIGDAEITDDKLKTTGFSDPLSPAGVHFIKIASADGLRSTGLLVASDVDDLAVVVQAYKLNQFAAPNANVDLGNQKITNLKDPDNPQDAGTMAYIDAAVGSAVVSRTVDKQKGGATPNLTVGPWVPPSKLVWYKVFFQFMLDEGVVIDDDTLRLRMGDDVSGVYSGGSAYQHFRVHVDGGTGVQTVTEDLTDDSIVLGTLRKNYPLVGEFMIGAVRPNADFAPDGFPRVMGKCARFNEQWDFNGSWSFATNNGRTAGSELDELFFFSENGRDLQEGSRVTVLTWQSA